MCFGFENVLISKLFFTFTHISMIDSCDKMLISDTQGRKRSQWKTKTRKKGKETKHVSWGKKMAVCKLNSQLKLHQLMVWPKKSVCNNVWVFFPHCSGPFTHSLFDNSQRSVKCSLFSLQIVLFTVVICLHCIL